MLSMHTSTLQSDKMCWIFSFIHLSCSLSLPFSLSYFFFFNSMFNFGISNDASIRMFRHKSLVELIQYSQCFILRHISWMSNMFPSIFLFLFFTSNFLFFFWHVFLYSCEFSSHFSKRNWFTWNLRKSVS